MLAMDICCLWSLSRYANRFSRPQTGTATMMNWCHRLAGLPFGSPHRHSFLCLWLTHVASEKLQVILHKKYVDNIRMINVTFPHHKLKSRPNIRPVAPGNSGNPSLKILNLHIRAPKPPWWAVFLSVECPLRVAGSTDRRNTLFL